MPVLQNFISCQFIIELTSKSVAVFAWPHDEYGEGTLYCYFPDGRAASHQKYIRGLISYTRNWQN